MQPYEFRMVRVQCVCDDQPFETSEPVWFEGHQSDTVAAVDGAKETTPGFVEGVIRMRQLAKIATLRTISEDQADAA